MLFGNGEIHKLLPSNGVPNIERDAGFLASGIALSKTCKFAILKAALAERAHWETEEQGDQDDGIEIW
jgi:hypothetical protein